jgi:hypothetical protein
MTVSISPSTLFCLNVPLNIRPFLEIALSPIGAVSFPSIKTPLADLIARVQAATSGAIAFWRTAEGLDHAALIDAGIALYWVQPGTIWMTPDFGEGERLPLTFNLEHFDAASPGHSKSSSGLIDPNAIVGTVGDRAAPAVETLRSIDFFPYVTSGKIMPVEPGGLTASTILIPSAYVGDGSYNQSIVSLIKRARQIGATAPGLISNNVAGVPSVATVLNQYRPHLSGIVDGGYSRAHLGQATRVLTTSAVVALDCAIAGLEVLLINGPTPGAFPFTQDQAAELLGGLNSFALDPRRREALDVQGLIGAMQSDSGVSAAPTPALDEPVAQQYRKTPPFKRVVKAKPVAANQEAPAWFNENQTEPGAEKFIGFIPWIKEHSDALMGIISPHLNVPVRPIRIIKDEKEQTQRRAAMLYALDSPENLRELVFSKLTPLKGHLHCVIFTFDWLPYMRVISRVCRDLGIPRILIPHESVFAKRSMYYVDSMTGIDTPGADIALAWGRLQSEIYEERRYPVDRVVEVGAPKFDIYRNGTPPQLTRAQYCKVFGLNPAKPIILFAAQPLDSQFDVDVARTAQRKAISDLLELAIAHDLQVIYRTPPTRASDVIGNELRTRILDSKIAKIDRSGFYKVSPFEALCHADIVTSINSTMLFEGVLLNKPSISLRYTSFESYWEKTSIAFVSNKEELEAKIKDALAGSSAFDLDIAWAENYLSNGGFDGQAAVRIAAALQDMIDNDRFLPVYDPRCDLVTGNITRAGNVALANLGTLKTVHQFLPTLINADNVGTPRNTAEAHGYDHYLRWGLADTSAKKLADGLFESTGLDPIYVEDGFLRSPGLGVANDPGLAVILDDITPYYDATRLSRMQLILNSDLTLTDEQVARARALIEMIVRRKISKYNHAPVRDMSGVRQRKQAILLVDQRRGDQSIQWGRADDRTFSAMVKAASALSETHDILVKLHPDAITGGKPSCFGTPRFELFMEMPHVIPVTYDVNPYSLLDVVDETWVATSGMGFEALMAGKSVRCFGVPFYAGRGLTTDELLAPERTKTRSLEEMFYVAYLMLSRYVDPRINALCDLEQLIDYLADVSLGSEI